jgi:hypothetical protein
MKKDPRPRKLVLKIETLGLLDAEQLQAVAGGETTTVFPPTVSGTC